MAIKIRKDDNVRIIAGKDKGRTGRVLRVDPKKDKVYVEGANIIKRHTRPRTLRDTQRSQELGGIVEKEGPIHVSNVMLLVEVDGTKVTTRVGSRREEVTKTRPDGTTYTAHRSVRIAKRSGEEI